MKRVWITNVSEDKVQNLIKDLNRGYKQRRKFVVGHPKETSIYNVETLLYLKMVGLYEEMEVI